MSTVTSDVDIVNMALVHLGSDRINSLSDTSRRAKIMNDLYPITRNNLIEGHPWNFAMKRVELAKLAAAPLFKFTSQFQLPTDLLRIWETDYIEGSDWVIEGDKLLSNELTTNILYISKVTDVEKYNAPFVDALALKLAYDGCYAITQNRSLRADLLRDFKLALSDARTFDGQADEGQDVEANDWANQRF